MYTIAYACKGTACYNGSWAVVRSYLETIYTLLGVCEMKLSERFKRLTLWNKLGFIGAVCSILAFLGWLLWPKGRRTSVRNEAKYDSVVQAPVNSPGNVVQTMTDSPGATQVAVAGDLNINVTNTAVSKEVTLSLSKVIHMNKQQGDLYHSRLQLYLVYDIPPANVYLAVYATGVESVQLAPMRTGMSMSGHSGKRDSYAFTNLQTPYPRLQLDIVSRKKIGTQTTPVGIEYRCE